MTEAPPEKVAPNKRSRRWLLEASVVGVAYAGITSFQTSDLLDDGSLAPAFATMDLAGNPVTLDTYAGKPLVLHFWAPWCGVCRQEFGMLNEYHAQRRDLLALVAEQPSEQVANFVREHDLRYPVVYAPPSLVRAYRVSAFPTTYYLSTDHRVSSATIGMSTGLAMRARSMLSG